jgi:hypothetical protein
MSDDRAAPKPAATPVDPADAEEAAFNANNHFYSWAIALGAMTPAEVDDAIRRDYPHFWARRYGTGAKAADNGNKKKPS